MATLSQDDPPPSYGSIMGQIDAQIKQDSSLEGLQKITANLTEKQIHILATNNDPDSLKKIQQDQKTQEKFRKAYVEAMTSDSAKRHLEFTADAAATACKTINVAFNKLMTKLGTVDALPTAVGQKKFSPDLLAIKTNYDETLLLSQRLATSIAVYAERFDDVIVPLILDSDTPETVKAAKLDQYIKDADAFAKDSADMKTKFENVKTTLRSLAATFASWSTGRESELQTKVDALTKEINDLTVEIEKLETQLLVSGAVAAASLPVCAVIAICCPVIAPIAIIAGCISAGVATGFAISYAVRISDRKDQRSQKEKERKELKQQIKDIQNARNELQEIGEKTVKEVETNINILANVWVYAMNDAVAMRDHLTNAKKDMNMPAYLGMAIEAGKAAGVYQQVAVYLRRYADGVSSK